jgi:hypothetical protein
MKFQLQPYQLHGFHYGGPVAAGQVPSEGAAGVHDDCLSCQHRPGDSRFDVVRKRRGPIVFDAQSDSKAQPFNADRVAFDSVHTGLDAATG